MKRLENLENSLSPLTFEESTQVNGGILGLLSVVLAVVYVVGEIAESAGRSYKKNYL